MNLLLIEDNLAEARLLEEVLKGAIRRFQLVHVKRLGEAIQQLQAQDYTVALLDLSLPDSQGLATLDSLIAHAPSLPIVVLTNTNDDKIALEAVQRGAQDFMVKRQVQPEILIRSLRYAIERKQSAEALREANEILEQRVQARTLELEQANQQLQAEVIERQHVQERLELAQKAGKIGTFEWNIETSTFTWSQELEALYRAPPGTFETTLKALIQRVHSDDRDYIREAHVEATQGVTALDAEFRIICPDEETRWIAAKGTLFPAESGRSPRMIGVHIDITEQKRLEEQFLRSQRLESLGTLASGIAHDLNNIFTPILGVSHLLALKLPMVDEQVQRMLQTLENSTRRGADLVKQILAFARGVEGKRMGLSVRPILREVEKILCQTLPKEIEIHIETIFVQN